MIIYNNIFYDFLRRKVLCMKYLDEYEVCLNKKINVIIFNYLVIILINVMGI